MRAGYDQAAATYSIDRDRQQRKYQRIEASLRELLSSGRVLDLGCGQGRTLAVAGNRGVGVDLSPVMLRPARQAGLRVVAADAHALPFAPTQFDRIVAFQGVFRYLDYPRALAECARVLVSGGLLGIHQFANAWRVGGLLRGRPTAHFQPLHLDDPSELIVPARDAGFSVQIQERWRALRTYPHAVRIPEKLPCRLWNHCVLVFRKDL